jgi:MraZ protein
MLKHIGEYEITIDSKGRFMLPAQYLRKLNSEENSFILKRGIENCLLLYTNKQWEEREQEILTLKEFNEEQRELKRFLLSGGVELEKDASGRVLIGKRLLEYAGITKDAIFFSQIDKVEIWDQAIYDQRMKGNQQRMNQLANQHLGGGDNPTPAS